MPTRPPVHRPQHARPASRQHDRARGSACKRGYGHAWRKRRLAFLMANPLCHDCTLQGRAEAATQAHHVERHQGAAYKVLNGKLLALCERCHSRRTARGE